MAFLLIVTAGLLIFFGRADQVAALLLPGIPPQLGAVGLLATLFLVAALIIPATRSLATILIAGLFTGLLYAARLSLTAGLSVIRTIFRLGYSAWHAHRE